MIVLAAAAFGTSAPVASDLDRAVDFLSLSRAARDGDSVSVRVLLDRGVDPNGPRLDASGLGARLTDTYERPLQAASGHGHADVVDLLLARGADPEWCCCSCVTALHSAILGGHEMVVRSLLQGGADPGRPYEDGRSCGDLARNLGHQDIASLLDRAAEPSAGTVAGSYHTVSESEWNQELVLSADGGARLLQTNWIAGEPETLSTREYSGTWSLDGPVVSVKLSRVSGSCDDGVFTAKFVYAEALSLQDLGRTETVPGLVPRPKTREGTPVWPGKMWRTEALGALDWP